MKNPSDQTIETYQQSFDTYVAKTRNEPSAEFREWMNVFLSYISQNGMILEIGSATGRDARYFASKGYKILCTDVIPKALQKLSEEGFETAEFDFRNNPKLEWIGKFDGIFANASLLHAPRDVFENVLRNAVGILNEGGVMAFSLKVGNGEEIMVEKLDGPRFFCLHTEPEIRSILSKLPFEIISISYVDNGTWMTVVIKLVAKP